MKKTILLSTLLLSSNAYANFEASGKIVELFVHEEGRIAVRLDSDYSSQAKAICPNYNGWAGNNANADPILKSTLLAASANKSTVRLFINGCEANGAWVKISSVYVQQ